MSEKVKEYVRQRDGYCCVNCGLTREQHYDQHGCDLHVHRIVPGSKYMVRACVTLCNDCHAVEPKGSRDKKVAATLPGATFAVVHAFCVRHGHYIEDLINLALLDYVQRFGHFPSYRAHSVALCWPVCPPDERVPPEELDEDDKESEAVEAPADDEGDDE